jgi:hypothetical protein
MTSSADDCVDVRYPVVEAFYCPACGKRIGDAVNVNGDTWIREVIERDGVMVRSAWLHRNTVSTCPYCRMLIKYRSPKGRM